MDAKKQNTGAVINSRETDAAPSAPVVNADRARSASAEELKLLLHDPREEILLALLENPKLEDAHVTTLLGCADLTANVIVAVAGNAKWQRSFGRKGRLRARGELLPGIEIAKRFGLVVEADFHDGERRIPRVDLATAAGKKGIEMRQELAPHEREHRVGLRVRLRDREIGHASSRRRRC